MWRVIYRFLLGHRIRSILSRAGFAKFQSNISDAMTRVGTLIEIRSIDFAEVSLMQARAQEFMQVDNGVLCARFAMQKRYAPEILKLMKIDCGFCLRTPCSVLNNLFAPHGSE